MKRLVLFFACCLLPTAYCLSQDFTPPKLVDAPKEKPPFWSWDRVYGGGGLGLQFGTVTLINVAPIIGYKITERYSVGVGIEYMYFAYKPSSNFPTYSQNIYGGNIFNRFFITNSIFAHVEYETLNSNWNTYYPDRRFFIDNFWVGGGLRQRAGNASLNIMALWNLNENIYSPFPNPQIRMGVSFGL
jgi:long-subunit fatty acid transport protein